MFAGGRRRSSNNVRAMQLFHELKQQFPTIPDHVVSACIASNDQRPADHVLREVLEAAATLQHELMGRNPSNEEDPTLSPTPSTPNNKIASRPNFNRNIDRAQNNLSIPQKQLNSTNDKLGFHKGTINNVRNALIKSNLAHASNSQPVRPERLRSEMNQSESDLNRNIIKKPESSEPKKPFKRPDTLEIRSDFRDSADAACRIKQSEKCKDVFKLLHSSKPPKSPGTPKRQLTKQSPNLVKTSDFSENSSETKKTEVAECKPQTVETPTQTTNTLLTPSVNLSLNVNCSMDLVRPKHSTALHVVPQQPWIQDVSSPRSFTSVNLTLRPPSSEPQPPIDITSQNSSLTYSTSTFDSQKGLQSKLQITVSPTGGSVSSVRTRPRSFHSGDGMEIAKPQWTGSVQDLSMSPVLLKQQARIERLRIELKSEKMRLVALQSEVVRLENSRCDLASERTDAELEKQLQKEIRHLRGQCDRLTVDVDRQTVNGVPLGETSEEFYRNIYTGQRGPFALIDRRRSRIQGPSSLPQSENFGPKWSCSLCTFQNHPLLDKCEQCDMARIVHGTKPLPMLDHPNHSLSDLLNLQTLNSNNAVSAANSLLQFVTNSTTNNPDYLRRHSEGISQDPTPEINHVQSTPSNLNNTH